MRQDDFIQKLIADTALEMVTRLTFLDTEFSSILVIGNHVGAVMDSLRKKWPEANLQSSQQEYLSFIEWPKAMTIPTVDEESKFSLPFASDTFELIVSTTAVTFYPSVKFAAECLRVLRDPGIVMVTAFGPNSFGQLQTACERQGEVTFNTSFVDMQDFADILHATGFANPVVDREVKKHSYSNIKALVEDLRNCDYTEQLIDNAERLGDAAFQAELRQHYPGAQDHTDELPLSIEPYYGIAWKRHSDHVPITSFPVH